jgi:ribosomal protein S8
LLWNNGYILGYRIVAIYHVIRIDLKYLNNKPIIRYLTLFSQYNVQQAYNIKQTYKLSLNFSTLLLILYTKFGIKTLADCKKQNLKGKLLAAIC